MGRGKSWTPEEDLIACTAYVRAWESCKDDGNRRNASLEARLLTLYQQLFEQKTRENPSWNRKVEPQERSGNAIRQRIKEIRDVCFKFNAILDNIKSGKLTQNPSEEDIERAAIALYYEECTLDQVHLYFGYNRQREPTTEFHLLRCFRYLRTTNLWKHIKKGSNALNPRAKNFNDDDDNKSDPDETREAERVIRIPNTGKQQKDDDVFDEHDNESLSSSEIAEVTQPRVSRHSQGNKSLQNVEERRNYEESLKFFKTIGKGYTRRHTNYLANAGVDRMRLMIEFFTLDDVSEESRKKFFKLCAKKFLMEIEKEIDELNNNPDT